MHITEQSTHLVDRLDDLVLNLRDSTLAFTLPVLTVAALLVLAVTYARDNWLWGAVAGLGLLGLLLLLLWLKQRNFELASWLFVLGSFAAILTVTIWGGLSAAIVVLVLPVGLAVLLLGAWPAMLLASAATVMILLQPGTVVMTADHLQLPLLLSLWGTSVMVWVSMRHLQMTVQSVWDTHERNQILLEQSRDFQLQLQQSLDDLKDANVQLTRLNQLAQTLRYEAEQERASKATFVANVSHELRTPLNMVVGFCEVIVQTPELYGENIPPALLADLDVVLRNAKHLGELIDDVLDLSQIDAGQMALVREWIRLESVIDSATHAVQPLFTSKGLYLQVDIAPDLPPVYCDETRIREVLLNLLSNAGRYADAGGVTVTVELQNDGVVVGVSDTGPGIESSEQERLFKPFSQLNPSMRGRTGGTGLGLSISKSFVEMHEGKMWVESVVDVGTTFYFRLPFEPPPPLSSRFGGAINPYSEYHDPRPRRAQPTVPARATYAVVEEGDALRRLVERHWDDAEFHYYANLTTALDKATETVYQALLVNDTQVDETIVTAMAAPTLPGHLPIIACAIPDPSQANRSMGIVAYLVKPVSQTVLLAAIERLGRPVRTLLLVEDDPDAMQLYRRILSSSERGYVVFRASNGLQALDVLQKQKVDLILMDLMMPEMDGFQFLAIRHKNPALADIPVILLSALDPQGQPPVCQTLAVSLHGGISGKKLVSCIAELVKVLSPIRPTGGSAS